MGLILIYKKIKEQIFLEKEIAKKFKQLGMKTFQMISNFVGDGWVYGGWYGGNFSYHLKR